MTAVTFAATIDRVLNGLTRPFFGWVSDMIGRENTMFIAFGIEGIGIWALYVLGHDPVWFVVLSGLVFFAWGEIYSLFPSTCTDTFGAKFATTNAGLLYTAKGTAALLVRSQITCSSRLDIGTTCSSSPPAPTFWHRCSRSRCSSHGEEPWSRRRAHRARHFLCRFQASGVVPGAFRFCKNQKICVVAVQQSPIVPLPQCRLGATR